MEMSVTQPDTAQPETDKCPLAVAVNATQGLCIQTRQQVITKNQDFHTWQIILE